MNRRCRTFFVTGTDTGIGKTWASVCLLRAAAAAGYRTLGLKPVASGGRQMPDGWRNDDALALMAAATEPLPYEQINPVALREAIAPHLAARRDGRRLAVAPLAGRVRGAILQAKADVCLIEGAGGWRVPLNPGETIADLVRALDVPVILVVGIRLGCINHAWLSAEAIRRDGRVLAGWIANHLEASSPVATENIATLAEVLPAPCLGEIGWRESSPLMPGFLRQLA